MGESRHERPRMRRHAMNRLLDAPQVEVDAVYRGCTTAVLGCVEDKRGCGSAGITA
jgi:hypothetical protein